MSGEYLPKRLAMIANMGEALKQVPQVHLGNKNMRMATYKMIAGLREECVDDEMDTAAYESEKARRAADPLGSII